MTTTWILVANASAADLYTTPRAKLLDNQSSLQLINHLEHPQSREKGLDLVADKLGHSGHGTFVESSEPKQQQADLFARELAFLLEAGRVKKSFDDLIIIAPSRFLGLLHKHINGQLKQLISIDIDKDYTKTEPAQLVAQMQNYL